MPQEQAQIVPPREAQGRRVLYITSAGDDGDDDVYSTIRSEITNQDEYYNNFRFIEQSIDDIRLGDRANLAVDTLQRASSRAGAELAMLIENPADEGSVEVSLSLFCVQNSELIAAATERRAVSAEGPSQSRASATQAAFQQVVATYFRRVAEGCPTAEFEAR